jgi:uncharacterized protein YukE
MTNYYQLSRDYNLAVDLLNKKNRLPVYLADEDGDVNLCTMWLNEDLEIMVDDQVEVFAIAHLEYYFKKNNAQFLLPIPDPTIALQHSLTAALNECDELCNEKASLNHELEVFKDANRIVEKQCEEFRQERDRLSAECDELRNQITNWKAMCDGSYSACADLTAKNKEQKRIMQIMETEIDALRVDVSEHKKAHEFVSKSAVGADLLKLGMNQKIEALERRVLAMTHEKKQQECIISRLTEANRNLLASCEDESDQDFKEEIVLVMQRITTALGLSWSCTDYDPADYERRIVDAIQAKDQELCIAKNDFAKESERLLAVLEDRYNKIDILEDNLERANADRLSEITMIMRLIQALDKTPQANLVGALHLIKRVLFNAICKLDPSQAIDL